MPRGSEQPAVLKYTVTQWFIQAVKRKESTAPSQEKPRSPSTHRPNVPTSLLPGAAGRAGQGKAWQRHRTAAFPGILLSQPFPGSQCLLWQGRVDIPTAQPRQEAEENSFTGEGSNAKTSPAKSTAGTAPAQQQNKTQAPTVPHSHPSMVVPLSFQGCAAGQECGRRRERAQANHPSRFPEDFDPLVLFKLSGRKSSRFTAQTGRRHNKISPAWGGVCSTRM